MAELPQESEEELSAYTISFAALKKENKTWAKAMEVCTRENNKELVEIALLALREITLLRIATENLLHSFRAAVGFLIL